MAETVLRIITTQVLETGYAENYTLKSEPNQPWKSRKPSRRLRMHSTIFGLRSILFIIKINRIYFDSYDNHHKWFGKAHTEQSKQTVRYVSICSFNLHHPPLEHAEGGSGWLWGCVHKHKACRHHHPLFVMCGLVNGDYQNT